jgi:hypothetical protein
MRGESLVGSALVFSAPARLLSRKGQNFFFYVCFFNADFSAANNLHDRFLGRLIGHQWVA